jgi:acylphosphatase
LREELVAKRYFVSGTVQGVGYRYFARGVAQRLGLSGYVRNLSDGRVEVYAIGPAALFGALLAELNRGPRSGRVSEVSEEPAEVESRFAGQFSIEYDD